MNRQQIEALLYRMQDAYPAAQPPRPGTIDEWATSSVQYQPADVAFRAFEAWRDVEQWPPTISQFIETCQETARQEARLRRETDEARARLKGDQQRERELGEGAEDPTLPGFKSKDEIIPGLIADAKAKVARAAASEPKPRHCPTCGQVWPLRKLGADEMAELGLSGPL